MGATFTYLSILTIARIYIMNADSVFATNNPIIFIVARTEDKVTELRWSIYRLKCQLYSPSTILKQMIIQKGNVLKFN